MGATSTGGTVLYTVPIAFLLLGEQAAATADDVASSIENSLQMATLMAWARAPEAADIQYTRTNVKRTYVYDRWVLLMLLVPALATALGTGGKWAVGPREMVPGYDPLVIASRGAVVGAGCLIGGITGENEKRRVKGVFYEDGRMSRMGFICQDQDQQEESGEGGGGI